MNKETEPLDEATQLNKPADTQAAVTANEVLPADGQIAALTAQLAEERRIQQKLLALAAVGSGIEPVPGPERMAHELARTLQRLCGGALACIFTCAPDDAAHFKLIASAGPGAAYLPANFALDADIDILAQAIRRQAVVLDGEPGAASPLVLDGQVYPALVAAPLLRGERLQGLILLATGDAQPFEPGTVTLVTAAQAQLVSAWEYAHQSEALTRFVQTVTMMSGIQEAGSLLEMIASIARRTLGAQYTLVATRNQQEWMMRASGRAPQLYRSLGNGGATFLEEAVKSPYTFRMHDLMNDPRSAVLQPDSPEMRTLLACPIRVNGSTTGVLLAFGKTGAGGIKDSGGIRDAGSTQNAGGFTEADVFLSELLVAHAAVNLESCYLNQELRGSLKTTQLLYDLSLNIAQAGSLTDAVRAIALTAYRLLQARRCGLLLFSTNGAVEAEVHFPTDDTTIQHPYRLIQQAMDSRQTIFLAENENLARTAIPIQTMRRCYGALWLEFPEDIEEARHPAEEIRILINQAAVALERSILLEETRQKASEIASAYDQLEQSYDQTLRALTRAQDVRDYDTERHSERVAEMAVRLGAQMGLSLPELKSLERGALLHDLGKIGVPDSILRKTGPLDPQEWDEMHKHPEKGAEIIQEIPALNDVLPVIANHHELWDGSGYPRRLRGEEIPLLARIFTVVDVFDAITSTRPYRSALSREDALDYLKSQAGKRYDAEIVNRFVEMLQAPDAAAKP